MAQSVSLSSVGTAQMTLNPLAKSTTVILSASTNSSNSTVQVEMSLDDLNAPGAPATATWATLSSGTAMLSSAVNSAGGLVYSVLSPISMIRINSTLNSSIETYTLKALQSITA